MQNVSENQQKHENNEALVTEEDQILAYFYYITEFDLRH